MGFKPLYRHIAVGAFHCLLQGNDAHALFQRPFYLAVWTHCLYFLCLCRQYLAALWACGDCSPALPADVRSAFTLAGVAGHLLLQGHNAHTLLECCLFPARGACCRYLLLFCYGYNLLAFWAGYDLGAALLENVRDPFTLAFGADHFLFQGHNAHALLQDGLLFTSRTLSSYGFLGQDRATVIRLHNTQRQDAQQASHNYARLHLSPSLNT